MENILFPGEADNETPEIPTTTQAPTFGQETPEAQTPLENVAAGTGAVSTTSDLAKVNPQPSTRDIVGDETPGESTASVVCEPRSVLSADEYQTYLSTRPAGE